MAAPTLKLTSLADDAAALRTCAQVLAEGRLAVVPMETVYGVLARGNSPGAVGQLRSLRPAAKAQPFAVQVASAAQALEYIDPPSEHIRRAMRKLWPGPISLVFTVSEARQREICTRHSLKPEDILEHGQITLRCPSHPAARQVLQACDFPVVGSAPPGDARRVEEFASDIADKVEMILDDGPAQLGKPSTILRLGERAGEVGFDIVRPGVYDRRIIHKMLQTMILFVCSGNTCRSPMAEAIARKVLAEKLRVSEKDLEKHGYTVLSAGASAWPGAKAADHAVEIVRGLGGDLRAHRSRSLTPQLIQQASVIFAMGEGHRKVIEAMEPSAGNKLALLDPEGEIEDPVGGDLSMYKRAASRIRQAIENRLANGTLFGTEK